MVSRRWLLTSSALAALGVAALAERRQLESRLGALQRRIARLDPRSAQPTTWAQTPPPESVTITIESTPTHRISPLIYGLAHANSSSLQATGARLNRWGGNPNSRYNWLHGNAWNAARDWEFRNYGAAAIGSSSAADTFVASNQRSGASTWLTVPALGWVARDSDSNHRSINVPADGGAPDPGSPDAIAGYDPAANRAATSVRSLARKSTNNDGDEVVYQDDWIRHLVTSFGARQSGGVQFYSIDNEPDLWSTTHTDVHPVQPDYEQMLAAFVEYAQAIKDVDATANVTGPALSGWTALWYSARDRGDDNFASHADRAAHGDQAFIAWWLDHLRQLEQRSGQRLLDVLDVHYYPQSLGVFGALADEDTQRRRLRSTRSLWDPTYVDESWIGEPVYLIPRLRAWRDQFYPGTLLGIGEWNWGADDTLNGALAIANVLGIFGREGIDLAAYWTVPPPGSPGEHAFTLFTNFDGSGAGFGDLSLAAQSSSPEDVAVYASRGSTAGRTLIVALNHRPDATIPVSIPPGGDADWYLYDAADLSAIRRMGQTDALKINLPPQSLSLLQMPPTSAGSWQ